MRISTKSQYGLRAMVYLAKSSFKNRVYSLKKISKNEEIPFDYLEKILSKLKKADLVKAKKGIQGGYFLAKKPEKIKIRQIIETLEGKMFLVKCLERKVRFYCSREKKCLTKNLWQKLQNSLNSTLNSITLADLIKK